MICVAWCMNLVGCCSVLRRRLSFAKPRICRCRLEGWFEQVTQGDRSSVDGTKSSEVSRTLTSATDVWIFYSQTEPRDLDSIAERCGREIANKVAELGLHDSFTWDVIARQIMRDSSRLLKRVPRQKEIHSGIQLAEMGYSKS